MTITFLICLSPFIAVSILLANKVHTIATIISGTEIFSIIFPYNFRFTEPIITQVLLRQLGFVKNC